MPQQPGRSSGSSLPSSPHEDAPSASRESLTPDDIGIGWLWWTVPDASFVGDVETERIVLWNPGAERLFGYSVEEAIGLPIELLMPERIRPLHRAGLARYRATGQRRVMGSGVSMEEPALTSAGEEITVELTLLPTIPTDRGNFVIAMARDITQSRQAEDVLLQREAQLAEAQQIAHLGSWEWDIASNAVRWSDELYRIYGIESPASEISYSAYIERIHPDDRQRVQRAILNAYRQREPFFIQHRVVRPDGTIRFIDARGRVVLDDAGEPVRLVGISQDITEQKQNEEELERRALERARLTRERAEVEAALRARDELLANISHDLKLPLTTIKGNIQILERRIASGTRATPEEIREQLRRIGAMTDQMTRLLDELLDATRLEIGKPIELNRQSTDLVALAVRAAEARQHAERPALRVEVPDQPVVGVWDARRLERVLNNLLDNAEKFSPEGGEIDVAVELERDAAAMRPSRAVLRVRDRGLGIPADDLPHIFERFHRAGNVTGRIPGSGIGLASARQIVEQHGGSIEVESQEGQGSTFTVRLPLAASEEESA